MRRNFPTEPMNEFELIADLFAPLATTPGAFGLKDDAAVFRAPEGFETVITKDVMIEGVHYLSGTNPARVAQKLLRVNLSDLAAMGAEPQSYLLGCQFREDVSQNWLHEFAQGLTEDQTTFGISLLGGDTTKTPGPNAFSLTAIGALPQGTAIRRSGVQPGDEIWVSGTIGDGAMGLMMAKGEYTPKDASDAPFLKDCLELPTPRIGLGQRLRGIASAAIDVSDGLIADLGHLARASGVGLTLAADAVPLSDPCRRALAEGASDLATLLTGGDDYELAFSAPAGSRDGLLSAADDAHVAITLVGLASDGEGTVRVLNEGQPMAVSQSGYRHF